LKIQEQEARWWRDASVLYFQTFSRRPIPEGYEPAAHDLDYYMKLTKKYVPGI
jgi:alpha-glucuronidase